jgi:hypothetical protein
VKEAGTAAAGEGDDEEEEEATGGFRIKMTFAENPYFTNTVHHNQHCWALSLQAVEMPGSGQDAPMLCCSHS